MDAEAAGSFTYSEVLNTESCKVTFSSERERSDVLRDMLPVSRCSHHTGHF